MYDWIIDADIVRYRRQMAEEPNAAKRTHLQYLILTAEARRSQPVDTTRITTGLTMPR